MDVEDLVVNLFDSDLIVNMYNVSEDLRSDYERAVHKQVSDTDLSIGSVK